MIFQATLSNKAHPEYGAASILFPIPNCKYDHIIEMLEAMGILARYIPPTQDMQEEPSMC